MKILFLILALLTQLASAKEAKEKYDGNDQFPMSQNYSIQSTSSIELYYGGESDIRLIIKGKAVCYPKTPSTYWKLQDFINSAKAAGIEQLQLESSSCTFTHVRKGPTQKEFDKLMNQIRHSKIELKDCHKLHSCDVSKSGPNKELDDIDKALKAYKPFNQVDSFNLPNMLTHVKETQEFPSSQFEVYKSRNGNWMGIYLNGNEECHGVIKMDNAHHIQAAKFAGEKVSFDRKNCIISRVKGPSQEDFNKLKLRIGQLETEIQKCKKGH